MKHKIIFGLLISILVVSAITLVMIRNGSNQIELQRHSSLENITFEEGVVNIYYFWGDSCQHCALQFEFLTELSEEIGERFNLYSFEVWFDEENVALAHELAEIMDVEFRGVPFTIIGNQTIAGFHSDEILDAIDSANYDEFDVMQIFEEER